MIRNIDAIIKQFCFQEVVKLFKIDSFFQRLVTCRIKNIIHHLIQQCTLIHITFFQNLLQCTRCLWNSSSRRYDHLRHIRRPIHNGLQLKSRVSRTVRCGNRILMMFYHILACIILFLVLSGQQCCTFLRCHIFLQIFFCFNQFQVMHSLSQTAVYILFKLTTPHFDHLLNIAYLQIKQAQERQSHYNS